MNGLKIKNSNNKKRKNTFSLLLIVFFILFLLLFSKNVSNTFYRISNPIQNSLSSIGIKTSDFFVFLENKKDLAKENQTLKEERQKLITEIVSLKELERENKALRKAMDLDVFNDYNLVFARVSGFDFLGDSFLINKGSQDGISLGMPVIDEQEITIGQVFEVYGNFSKVAVITHQDKIVFDAEVQESEAMGVIRGTGRFGLILDLVSKEKEINEGDFIVTMGEIFPPGLPVGKIKEVIKIDTEPFQKAKVLPFFNPKTVRNVFVITDYQK